MVWCVYQVVGLMKRADQWGLLAAHHHHGDGEPEVRVCEYHDYAVGGKVGGDHHCDRYAQRATKLQNLQEPSNIEYGSCST